jgi:hypothetical protein
VNLPFLSAKPLSGFSTQRGCAAKKKIKRQTLIAGWPSKGMKMPAGGPAAAQGRRPTGFLPEGRGRGWEGVLAARQEANPYYHRAAGRKQDNRQ